MRALLIIITFLIVYGSLYPFKVELNSYHPLLLEHLYYFGLANTGRGDLLANILLFVPFGVLAINVFLGRRLLLRLVFVLVTAFLLAFVIQAAQLVIPSRVPAGSDAVWNTLGCAIGCLLGLSPLRLMLFKFNGARNLPSIPVVLALLWLMFGLAPFIPSIDLQLLKDHLKAVIHGDLSALSILQHATMWSIVFHFIGESKSRFLVERNYPIILALSIVGSFFVVDNSISSERIIGGVVALVTWPLIRKIGAPPWLAIALVIVIVGVNHTPFVLRDNAISFSWVPFSGALGGNLFINVLAVAKKMILYGSLIWLLVESRLSLRVASISTAALLFVSEFLQTYFISSTPEITDPLLALALGIAFSKYKNRADTKAIAVSDVEQNSTLREADPESRPEIRSRTTGRAVSAHYLAGMDGLRAIAALAVFFVHFNQQVGWHLVIGPFDLARFLANGNTGVALFFVLSGLLLSLPFWQRFSVKRQALVFEAMLGAERVELSPPITYVCSSFCSRNRSLARALAGITFFLTCYSSTT